MHERTGDERAYFQRLGAKVQRLRARRNLTRLELAAMAGIGYQALGNIECGRPCRMSNLFQVSRALKVAMGALCWERDTMNEPPPRPSVDRIDEYESESDEPVAVSST